MSTLPSLVSLSFCFSELETRKETKGLAKLRRSNRFQEDKVEGKSKAEFQEEGIHEGKELPKSSVTAP